MRVTHLRSGAIAGGAKIAVDRIATATSTLPDLSNQIIDLYPSDLRRRTLYGFLRHRVEHKLFGWSLSETILPDYRVAKKPETSGDILHLHNLYGSGLRIEDLVLLTKKKNVIWTMHDNRWLSWAAPTNLRPRRLSFELILQWMRTIGSRLLRRRLAKAIQGATIVFPSNWLRDQAVASGFVDENHTAIIPNPLPIAFFDRSESKLLAKKRMGLDPGKPVVTFVSWKAWKSKGDMNKGYDLIELAIPNAKKDGPFTFAILGHDGAHIPGKLGAVWIQPDGSEEQIISLFQASDLVLGASREEVLPTVIQEAQALGVPAVVPGATGYQDVVLNGITGLYFLPGNTEDFAKKISSLVRSPELREQLGTQAAERAAHLWHPDRVRLQYSDLYKKAP